MRNWRNNAVSNLICEMYQGKAGTCRVCTVPVSQDCSNRCRICNNQHHPNRCKWIDSNMINTIASSKRMWILSNTARCFHRRKLIITTWRLRNRGPRYLWARANPREESSWQTQTNCRITTALKLTAGARAAPSATRSDLYTMKASPANRTTPTKKTTSWIQIEILMI